MAVSHSYTYTSSGTVSAVTLLLFFFSKQFVLVSVILHTLLLDPFNSKQSEFHAPRSICYVIGPLPVGCC